MRQRRWSCDHDQPVIVRPAAGRPSVAASIALVDRRTSFSLRSFIKVVFGRMYVGGRHPMTPPASMSTTFSTSPLDHRIPRLDIADNNNMSGAPKSGYSADSAANRVAWFYRVAACSSIYSAIDWEFSTWTFKIQ